MSESSLNPRQLVTEIGAPALGAIRPRVRQLRASIVPLVLVAGDFAAALLVMGLAATVNSPPVPPHFPISIALLFVAFSWTLRLYRVPGPTHVARLRLRSAGSFCAVGLGTLLLLRAPTPFVLLRALGEALLLIIIAHYVEWALRAALMRAGLWGAAALIVKGDQRGQAIANALRSHPEIGLLPMGFVDDSQTPLPEARARWIESPSVLVFTSYADMARALSDRRVGGPLICALLAEDSIILNTMAVQLPPRMIGGTPVPPFTNLRSQASAAVVKRVIDLSLSIPLALAALPIVAILTCLIFVVDPGRPLFSQTRVGHRGRPIRVWKVRTMYSDAQHRLEAHLDQDASARAEWDQYFKLKRDPRVLPLVGNFLRRCSLDELPQFWNVIRGDMSLVGPRPFPAYHVRVFDPEFQLLRTSIKPGLTGLWQVSSRSEGDINLQREQDCAYIKCWSLWLDFYILLETLPAVLRGRGAR